MADTITRSDIFKFVALRPPVTVEKAKQAANFTADDRPPAQTPVGQVVADLQASPELLPNRIAAFIESNGYRLDFPGADSPPQKVLALARSFTPETYEPGKLVEGLKSILGTEAGPWLATQPALTMLTGLWDRYQAFLLLSRTQAVNLENLTNNLRAFHLLKFMSAATPPGYATLQNILSAKLVVPKHFAQTPRPAPAHVSETATTRTPARQEEYSHLWGQLIDTQRALEEIRNLRFESKTDTQVTELPAPHHEAGGEARLKLSVSKNQLVASPRSLQSLHLNTRKLVGEAELDPSVFNPMESLARLQNIMAGLYARASSIDDPAFAEMMPLDAKIYPGLIPISSKHLAVQPPQFTPPAPTTVRPSIKPLGIGDLKVVKQKLRKYVAGEVAHIENVLRGEYKERKHRVLDRTEDILTVTNETEEETTKDTQTTERFELKKESEKTVQEQMSVQAGVTVSGSYGMVTFGAHGDFAYSTASTESNKSSSNFAREVIDKSVSKIQKRTKEERTTKQLHEVEEINTHGLDNKEKPDHAVGIYRWVDKYYDAQVFNYGKRMMFEFIIPEPAAFWDFAQTHRPKPDLVPPKPLAPDVTHKSLTLDNYQAFIRDYNVQGVLPPPPLYKTMSTSIVKEGMPLDGNAHGANSKELVVPAGYIANVGLWWDCSAVWSHYPILEVTIGNKIFRPLEVPRTDGNFDTRFSMGNNHDRADIPFHWFWPESPIQVSVNSYDVLSYTINVYARCERTGEAMEQWQIQTFEKIMAAYKAMQAEYEQKVAAQETMQGIAISGQNPRFNRQIERVELKKQCVKMLMDTYLFGTFDAMKDGGANPPDFDIFDAVGEGKTIQFFEQAFEWENLTYLFYPYFWARRSEWPRKAMIFDVDPLFTEFLQAGSARVVLPVRPAYNDALMYFLENNGAIWGGGEPPSLSDPLFISLSEELRNLTDDLANAAPEGEPWEVVLPTTLVYLQQDAELPTFDS